MITRDEIRRMIADCETCHSDLSEWEQEFIESIREQFDVRGSLSERQLARLQEIWDKKT